MQYIYNKVETRIIARIGAISIGRAVILVIIYVETFKTDFIVFIVTFDATLTDNFQYQGQFVDSDNITR
jgi:hypothetical protein